MRVAELVMAAVMALFSLYLMWKSTELPIGWLPGRGPGGGAFPFWLSAGMLICCGAVIVNRGSCLLNRWHSRTVLLTSNVRCGWMLRHGCSIGATRGLPMRRLETTGTWPVVVTNCS